MKRLILLLMLVCSACQWSGLSLTPSPTLALPTAEVTASPTSTISSPTPTLTPSATPAPYESYTIDFLRGRTYGGGNIEITEIMEVNDLFTRYLIRYPSDG